MKQTVVLTLDELSQMIGEYLVDNELLSIHDYDANNLSINFNLLGDQFHILVSDEDEKGAAN